MSIVSWMVGTADGFLADAAESQFGAVASNTGTIVLLTVTLSLIGVCINMAFQFRSMDGASFFWYLIKLTLIGLFAFNWANFNAVANAVIGGLDYVAGALISSVGGGGAGHLLRGRIRPADHRVQPVPERDRQQSELDDRSDPRRHRPRAPKPPWLHDRHRSHLRQDDVDPDARPRADHDRAVALRCNEGFLPQMGLDDDQLRLCPIVIAAMFSTVVGMANSLLAQLGDPNSATNIGSLVPFFVMVFLAKGFVAATPLIVRGILGTLMVAAAPAIANGSAGVPRGLVNTSGVQGRARIGALTTGEAIGRGAVQAPAVVRSAAATASAQVVRIAERAKRLGR